MLGTFLEVAIIGLLTMLVVGPSGLAAFRSWRERAQRKAALEARAWPERPQVETTRLC